MENKKLEKIKEQLTKEEQNNNVKNKMINSLYALAYLRVHNVNIVLERDPFNDSQCIGVVKNTDEVRNLIKEFRANKELQDFVNSICEIKHEMYLIKK